MRLNAGPIRRKYKALEPLMDESLRRRWAGAEARALGYGGVTCVSAATGLARTTIHVGLDELKTPPKAKGQRRAGGGRKPLTFHDPELQKALDDLVDPVTRGDPQSPLRWTSKSVRKLSLELKAQGHPVSPQKVCTMLSAMGYSLQGNRKSKEGASHPDRNE